MSRLSAVARDALPEPQRRFYDAVKAIRRRPVSGPFIVLMNSSPDLAARYAHLGHYFHARGQADESIVPLRVRSYLSLIGSRALDAPYEWGAWVNWALDAGVPQASVDAIREGSAPPHPTAEDTLTTDFCAQLISGNHRVSAATFKAAHDHFGTQGLVELVVTLGYFAMIALPLNAFEIEMSSEQKGLRKPFAPLRVTGQPWSARSASTCSLPPLNGETAPPRIPLLSAHDDVAPEHQHFMDRVVRTRGWISPAFGALLHSPDIAERIAHIGGHFLFESALPAPAKMLTWLIAAREFDSDYTWRAGIDAARAAGIDVGLIAALEQGAEPRNANAEQTIVLAFCRQLLRGNHHIGEATYQAAIRQFGVPATIQVAATLGYVVMMSVLANAFELTLPNGETRPAL